MDQELICRTCFTKTTRCLPIFSEYKLWDKDISLYKMIMACAPVEISLTDGLPSKICENCFTKLQYSFLFRMQILQADIKLKNYARKTRVFHSNSVIGDLLPEPILKDSKSNIEEIYSLDQILQSSPVLNADVFDSDEFNKSTNKNKLKTEPIKNEIIELMDEVIVISDEDVIHLEAEKQICSMKSNKVHVEEVIKTESNNSPQYDETEVNPDILPTVVTSNKNNVIQIVPTPQIYSDDLSVTYTKIDTHNKHSVSSVTVSTNDCNVTNTNNSLLDQTISICSLQNTILRDNANLSSLSNKSDPNRGKTLDTIKNVSDDRSQVNETSDKLQKTSMYPKDERPLYGQNRSTCDKQSTTKRLTLVIKHNVNGKANTLEALEIPNKNLNQVNPINTKMKNITREKDERNNGKNSHLSQKINLTDQITPVTSSVRGKASEISSCQTKNCVFSQKNSSHFRALMTVDDFKAIGNKTDAHSTIKLYKIPTNTLHKSTVVNCNKQGNDVSVSDTSKPRDLKNQITSIKQDNAKLCNKIKTRSNSGSSTPSSTPCDKSSIQKYVNKLTVINVKNNKQENTTITNTDSQQNLQDFKRKANHKVYVNKRKKYI